MMKNKKGGMEISIVLLVLATLILSTFALYTFYTKQKSMQEKIYITKFLEDIYSKEEQINFYIDNILEKSAKDFNKEDSEEKLIENFTRELSKYKINNNYIVPELAQIEEQVNEEHIKYDKDNQKVTAEFQITLEDKVADNGKELFSAVYTYTKKFEKEI